MAVNSRTGERLVRMAYDLGKEGFERESGTVLSAMKNVRSAGDSRLWKFGK